MRILAVIFALMFIWACFIGGQARQEANLYKQQIAHMQITERPVASCPEDEVLIGDGDFNDRWTTYVCGPARDSYETQDYCYKLSRWTAQIEAEHYRPKIQRLLAAEAYSEVCGVS